MVGGLPGVLVEKRDVFFEFSEARFEKNARTFFRIPSLVHSPF